MAQQQESIDSRVDLHTHTTFSDGTLTPTELIDAACEAALVAVAITDHDTVAGIHEACDAARSRPIEMVAGVELSSRLGQREIHLLGLFIDADHPDLNRMTKLLRQRRLERAVRILERLHRVGAPVELDSVQRCAGPGTIGRPHVARAMVLAGHVTTADQAFRQYIGLRGPAYVAKETLPAEKVIRCVHAAGGVAVVAHAASSRLTDAAIIDLAGIGLDGIEVHHPNHDLAREKRLERLAARLRLPISGGSDFHGPAPGRSSLGSCSISPARLEDLRRRAGAYARPLKAKEEAQ